MKARVIIIFGLAVLLGMPSVSAQSFKEKLKNATEKVGKQVKQEVSKKKSPKKSPKKSKNTSDLEKRRKAIVGKEQKIEVGTTAKLPDTHTALFAPLSPKKGTVDAKWGTKSVKATKPPKDETKQPDWNDAQISAYELDNKSLVEAFVLMDKCFESGYFSNNSPASFRWRALQRELDDRLEALERMVEEYDEARYEYENAEDNLWVIDHHHQNLSGIFRSRAYHALVRSSIAPFFTTQYKDLAARTTDAVRKYFNNHGGYENAHKANFTVWDPDKK